MSDHIFFNSLNILFDGDILKLEKEFDKIKNFKTLWEKQNNKTIDPIKEYEKLTKYNIRLILKTDKDYPKLLAQISHPPLGIYIKGDISILKEKKNIPLAIVGSRDMTTYGKQVCEKLIKELAPFKFVIISGLAYGIDTISHKQALESNLKTIAVLGSGLEHIYPEINKPLAKKIIEKGGCLISEYPIYSGPKATHFPQRNRTISGLSKGVLVIEAQERSGSLITAKLALDQNRDVFAVPNNIFEKTGTGTNKLIQSGAKLILNSNDILEEFNLFKKEKTKKLAN